MPAVYLFQRRTLLASDDFHLPAILTILFRIFQLVAFVAPMMYQIFKDVQDSPGSFTDFVLFDPSQTGSCRRSHIFPLLALIWLVGSISFCIASIAIEHRIFYWSGQGSPTMSGVEIRRHYIQKLLESKLAFCTAAVMALCVLSLTATGFASRYTQCHDDITAAATISDDSLLEDQPQNGDDASFDDDIMADETSSSTSNQRLGSAWWWLPYSMLTTTQIVEVLLSTMAAILLCRLNRQVDFDGRPPVGSVDSINSGPQPIPNSPSSEMYFYRRRTEADLGQSLESLWLERVNRVFQCLAYSTCFLFGGRDLVSVGSRHHTVHNSSNDDDGNTGRGHGNGGRDGATTAFGTNAYEQLARIITDYFAAGDILDVTPTDIAAGLLVVQRVQRLGRLRARLDVMQQRISTQHLLSQRQSPFGRIQSYPAASTPNRSLLPSYSSSSGSSASAASVRSAPTSPIPTHQKIRSRSPNYRRSNSSGLRSRTVGSNDSTQATTSTSSAVAAASATTTTIQTTMTSIPAGASSDMDGLDGVPTSASAPLHATYQTMTTPSRRSIYRRVPTPDLESGLDGSDFRQETSSTPYRKETRKILNPAIDAADRKVMLEGARYARHALSIYTWKLYVYAHPLLGPFRLLRKCMMCQQGGMPSSQTNQASNASRQQSRIPPRPMSPTSFTGLSDSPVSSPTQQPDTQTLLGHENGFMSCTVGDNFCQFHKQALLLTANLDESDLVYAHFVNSYLNMPYCIVLDHANQSVVLSIRGTLSLDDAVTDALIDAEPLDPNEFNYAEAACGADGTPPWQQQYGFNGAVACARNVYDDLQRHKWLHRLLLGNNALYPTYSLRLTGHSLGASTAVFLSFKLRKEHPTLRVYSYSPVGCTVTWELAQMSQQWTTSFVLDSDIVPRGSVLGMQNLRDEALQVLGRIKVPKHRVLAAFMNSKDSWLPACCSGKTASSSVINENDTERLAQNVMKLSDTLKELLSDETPMDTAFQDQLNRFLSLQSHLRSSRGPARSAMLFPPGKIVHLIKTGEQSGCCSSVKDCVTCSSSQPGSNYTPVWINNDDLNEVVVSPTMMTDHFVDRMCDELEKLVATMDDVPLSPNDEDGMNCII